MKRFGTMTTLSTATVIGLSALMLSACNEAATTPSETTGAGGNQESTSDDEQPGVGGSAAKSTSSKTTRGGSSAKTSANKAQGGEDSSSDEEGGAGGADEATGGRSASKTTKSSSTKGSSTSTSSTKATGGKTGTGGTSAKSSSSSSSASKGGASSTTATSSTSTSASTCTTDEEKKFSFFLASHAALTKLSGSSDGFGGKLGGLAGADKICQQIAETSAPCHKDSVVWHAFLSTPSENAKDRIGTGPWYDRRGRLLSQNMTNLLKERPSDADDAIINDFPNENGVPNHNPDGTGNVDNHQILTGTGTDGNVYTQSTSGGGGGIWGGAGGTSCGPTSAAETWSTDAATCWGWTTNEPKGCPRVGHSWPREISGIGWISVWNEGGCAPGGVLTDDVAMGGPDGTRRVGSAGGYGGFYCFAVTGK